MNADRRQQISRLYQAALGRQGAERAAFLADACRGDDPLRHVLSSLLAEPALAEAFLDAPTLADAAQLVSDVDASALVARRLGVYQIQARLGAGGMGEVYRARDTKLGRDVAIKILPRGFTSDPERLARFEREARMLAALNHPHIGAIYGLEDADGIRALVLELVEGETLASRIARGPIPQKDALPIARQIAEALEAAHGKGIVHRDLKPANVALTREGSVKVLDFGLAKAVSVDAPAPDLTQSPTVSAHGTLDGVVLGTAAYMSPEQARGLTVDKRTDIWAFGCVLFEMLTGRATFDGRSVSDIIAAVLRAQPDWSALPDVLHPRIRLLLERCLEKDIAMRYHDIADARVDVHKALADPTDASVPQVRPGVRSPVPLLWMAVALTVGAIAAGLAAWNLRPPLDRAVHRFSDVLPQNRAFSNAGWPLVAVSPDGSHLAYVANNRIFLRSQDRLETRPIAGTEGSPTTPFFSPDGRFVGYWDLRDGELRRIAIAGGTPVSVAKVTNVFGARWEADDTILYGTENGVWKVSASGGTQESVLRINPGERVHAPQLLPDGESILFTWRASVGSARWEDAKVMVQSLRTGERKTIAAGSDARLLPTGHLVYAAGSVLFAIAFDLSKLEPVGGPVPVIEGILRATAFPGSTGSANYDVSSQGVLVYRPGEEYTPVPRQLVAVARNGNAEPLVAEMRDYWRPRVSPDGSHIAVEVNDDRGEQLWIIDRKDGTALPLITEGARNIFCAWTPDGSSVIFRSDRADRYGMYRAPADGSGAAQLLYATTEDVMPGHVSHDGVLVFASGEQTGRRSIWTMGLDDTTATEFLATPALEHMPAFSPDGKWIAYASDESGRADIYIRPYPAKAGLVRRISEGGGTAPVWAPDGSELYYRSASGNLMAVPLRVGTGIASGRAVELFRVQGRFRISGNAAAYDIEPGGRRFIMVTEPESPRSVIQQVNSVLNWFEELKRLVPTK